MADDLFKAALGALENAYAPYSDHPVGAALRTNTGQVYLGCNVEAAHYNCTHAEASAISAMVAAGERHIDEIVIVGPGALPCTPCGDCRQRIREFSDMTETRIFVYNRQGEQLKSYNMAELLPDSFGPEHLE